MMASNLSAAYPVIEGNTSNFIDDYIANFEQYDRLIAFQFGERVFTCDTEDLIPGLWNDITDAIVLKHITEFARLYYALSLQYNPIWNVDGTEVFEYGKTKNTNVFGEQNNQNVYGQIKTTTENGERNTESTTGSRTNTSTDSTTAYPSAQRHEASHNENTMGAGTDTTKSNASTDINTTDSRTDTSKFGTHTDTQEADKHTDTHIRSGNIGVTMTQQLLDAEWKFRQKSFFDDLFRMILLEVGLMYE